MKITIVLLVADMSGGAKVIGLYADRLRKRGHEVLIVSSGAPPSSLRTRIRVLFEERRWIPRIRQFTSHIDELDVPHHKLDRYRGVEDRDVPDADVVVATFWRTAEPVSKLSPSKGAKAYYMQDYGAPGMELEDLIPTWKLPMHIITLAEWLAELVEEHGGRTPVSLVRCAVEAEHFHAEPRGKQAIPTVGFNYRETEVKGFDIVLEAFRRARLEIPNLRLLAYGPFVPRHTLPEGMDFRLEPATEDLRHIYAACDAWLFASRREGFGLPAIESMACRTPVIGTPAGVVPELIRKFGGGVVVAPEDPADMARAIVRFARMPEGEWKSFSDRAYASVEGYTWEDAVDLFEAALYRTIELEGRPRPAPVVPRPG